MTRSHRQEVWWCAPILMAIHCLMGSHAWAFAPEMVAAGQWWRLLLHPFVHVSWYHLALDGLAFLFLYASLREPARWRRFVYIGAASLGSAIAAWQFAPEIRTLGLCGLSTVAHGLMAVIALELIISRETTLGWTSLGLVAGKAVWEAVTGHVFLEFAHADRLGTPIAVSHLGGVIGAVGCWIVFTVNSREFTRIRYDSKATHDKLVNTSES